MAVSSPPVSEAFARSVALIDHGPVGYVASSGPAIGQSIFPGATTARSLAATGQHTHHLMGLYLAIVSSIL